MRICLLLTSLAVLISCMSLPLGDAHAMTYDLKDETSCKAISGTWDTTTLTCTVSDLYLNSGDSFSVDDSIFSNISLKITDTLDNKGVINNSGNIMIGGSAVFNNEGSVLNYCGNGCIAGTIQNQGSVTNNKGANLASNSTIDNLGSINNAGTITINDGGTLTNSAKFINNFGGLVNNFGTIHNNQLSAIINSGGTITNYATIISDMGGTITNSGLLKNMCNSTFTSNGDLLGTPVNNTSCKSSTVPEFPFASLTLVLGFLPLLVFFRAKG